MEMGHLDMWLALHKVRAEDLAIELRISLVHMNNIRKQRELPSLQIAHKIELKTNHVVTIQMLISDFERVNFGTQRTTKNNRNKSIEGKRGKKNKSIEIKSEIL